MSDGRTNLDRRAFLRRAGLGGVALGTSLLGGGLLEACSSTPRSSKPDGAGTTTTTRTQSTALLDLPARSSPITHVVVVMMENRSFDHWLGWLATDDAYLEDGHRRYGSSFRVDGDQQQEFPGTNGPVTTRHLTSGTDETNPYRGCGHPDPGHTWEAGRAERDHGFLAHDSGNDVFALSYYLGDDLPFTSRLAKRFTVCDHSHASLLSSTFPNRMYMHSAQSGGNKGIVLPTNGGLAWDTIWDRLAAAEVPCGYYKSDLPFTFLWGDRLTSITHSVEDFFDAAKAGKLPNVSFVDPAFIGPLRTDNHPFGDINAGERFVADLFRAFAKSPHWKSGAFILTYDEWGGFFDHVPPPRLPDDRASSDDNNDFSQAGFRIPTVIASPFARRGYIDHQIYDHTSVLRFLEWRFLGAPPTGSGGDGSWSLTKRDRNAANIGASLVEDPDHDLGFDPALSIPTPTPACAGDGGGKLSVRRTTDLDSPPIGYAYESAEGERGRGFIEDIRDSGWFEDHGVDVTQSPMIRGWVSG